MFPPDAERHKDLNEHQTGWQGLIALTCGMISLFGIMSSNNG